MVVPSDHDHGVTFDHGCSRCIVDDDSVVKNNHDCQFVNIVNYLLMDSTMLTGPVGLRACRGG